MYWFVARDEMDDFLADLEKHGMSALAVVFGFETVYA